MAAAAAAYTQSVLVAAGRGAVGLYACARAHLHVRALKVMLAYVYIEAGGARGAWGVNGRGRVHSSRWRSV
jgi:hypothetical protein